MYFPFLKNQLEFLYEQLTYLKIIVVVETNPTNFCKHTTHLFRIFTYLYV